MTDQGPLNRIFLMVHQYLDEQIILVFFALLKIIH